MTPIVSYILPLYGNTHLRNARVCIDSIAMFAGKDIEVLVCVPENDPYIGFCAGMLCKVIPFKPNDSDWQLSTARNAGAAVANGTILLFHDVDAIAYPGMADAVRSGVAQHGFCGSYNRIQYLSGKQSEVARDSVRAAVYPDFLQGEVAMSPVAGGGCGLSFAIRKDLFEQVGQWDVFNGWGHDDVALRCRLSDMFKVSPKQMKKNNINKPIFHMDHQLADKSQQPANARIARRPL